MSALDDLSFEESVVVRIFAYPFNAAPTADIITSLAAELSGGTTAAELLDLLFNYPVNDTPFPDYANSASDLDFVTALVDNLSAGIEVSQDTQNNWVDLIAPLLDDYPTRGDFVVGIVLAIEAYTGNDADLIALRDGLHDRAEAAAEYAASAAGATWDGEGWTQLVEALAPPPPPEPTYALSTTVSAADEGSSVTFTLQTTNVDAGTSIAYTLAGTGITTADIGGAPLSGNLTVGANGSASLTLNLANDQLTEGAETLRMALAGNLAAAQVIVNDTSLTPPTATYALSADVTNRNEGGSITYTLTTTQVAAGTMVPFSLSGTGISTGDVTIGALVGAFAINAQGIGTFTLTLTADQLTEGAETLRLQLDGRTTRIDVTINDTSTAPPPTGTNDTTVIADAMNNSNAHAPTTPVEGEIDIDSYLNYDLLDQRGSLEERLTIAELRTIGGPAGAAPDATNSTADRGNIAQVSNQDLFTFDLGLGFDRVDYSAETGKIVAVLRDGALTSSTQLVIVNDNGTNDDFNDATDRIDTLRNVEQVVASAGGGVIDLTHSGRDWTVAFSRNFDPDDDVDGATDRAVHETVLIDMGTGLASGRSFLEYRDGGELAGVTQATAAWTTVQGSDHDETLEFTAAQSLDERANVLRGGTNSVKFNELTRSILVDVGITPWAESTSAADDGNSSGRITATTRFTNGNGVTLLSAATNVSSSHTPDNQVAAGVLKLAGSQDAEDAISFDATTLPLHVVLGQTINSSDTASVRLAGAASDAAALEFTGFEFLADNPTDDVYEIDDIAQAVGGSPALVDDAAADHDAIVLDASALGSDAVGGQDDEIDLAVLNGAADGFDFDFDVLDISAVDSGGLAVAGTAGTDDELVVGDLAALDAVTLFEALVLTDGSVDGSTELELDLDSGTVRSGATALFTYDAAVISGAGLVFGDGDGYVDAMTEALDISVTDGDGGSGATLWGGLGDDRFVGGSGNDTLRGGGGNDELDGGEPSGTDFAERWSFALSGTPDAVAAAGNRIAVTLTVDGTALTLTEAAVADTDYSDGAGAVVDGASTAAIGAALAALVNANLDDINAGAGTGTVTGASFSGGSGTLQLDFLAGIDANDVVTAIVALGAGPDGGNFAIAAGVNDNGGSGGSDTFVFEATAALNGSDTIDHFTIGSDLLDMTAFAGGAITGASPAIDAATGGTFAGVATTAELVFNKSGGTLSASDFATSAAAGKFVIGDGERCVVAVTADPTGDRGDTSNTDVRLYYVVNGATAGLSDLSVALVGTVGGPSELALDDIAAAFI